MACNNDSTSTGEAGNKCRPCEKEQTCTIIKIHPRFFTCQARKELQPSEHNSVFKCQARSIKMVAPNRQMVAPNRQSLARIVSAFPRHVPDARTAKGVARRAVKRSRQTLVAFRRAAQLVGIVRYLNDVQGRRRRDRQGKRGRILR